MEIAHCLRRVGAACAVLVAALLLASCFESHCAIKVKKDGSGTLENTTIMSAQMVGVMNAAGEGGEGSAPGNPLLEKERLTAIAKSLGEGVEFVAARELKFDDGRMGVAATYKFADIRKVTVSPGSGSPGDESGRNGEVDKNLQIRFAFAQGEKPVLTVKMPKRDEAKKDKAGEPALADGKNAEEAQAMAMMTQMLQGMKIGVSVEVDGKITETTATNRKDSTVTLMEIDFGKLMANPGFAKKVNNPDLFKNSPELAEMAKEFGATVEPKDEISITFE